MNSISGITRKTPMKTTSILAFACSLAFSIPAWAAGDAVEPAAEAAAVESKSAKDLGCKRGEVAKVQSCIAAVAGVLSDDEFYEQGKLLAEDNEYDWAIDVLALIKNQDQAKVLNYVGYSHRKAGRLETGIAAYQKAISLDPNYLKARSYLGQAYILAGKKDLATAELAEIKTRCGAECPEYKELEKALAGN
jgi:Flp pilus assembly protein TadD